MRERLLDFVPRLYAGILPELFERPKAEERHATCDRCVMCKPTESVADGRRAQLVLLDESGYFSPSTKCCTYHPLLPNYLVGGLLEDASPEGSEGRRRVLAKIARRAGVTPVGIEPDPKSRLLYGEGARLGFGRASALACPYLADGVGCTVWSHREAVCATWFCKHEQGQDGLQFWHQLRDFLLAAQRVLSMHALRELGFDADHITRLWQERPALDVRALDDEPPSAEEHEARWRNWVGRESEFYVRCHELVRGVDRATFARLGGLALEIELERLTARHDAIERPTVPDPLQKNPSMRIERAAEGSYLLVAYVGTDVSRLRKGVYDVLDRFDGHTPTETVRAELRRDTGQGISDALLTKLYQHRILVAGKKV